jgi:hypothetical protein
VLDPVSVRNEHVRESALNNVQIAQAVTLDQERRTGCEGTPVETTDNRGQLLVGYPIEE